METQLIPSSEMPGLESALAKSEQYGAELAPLNARLRSITIVDPETYSQVGAILTETRNIRKQVKATFSPFTAIVDRVKDFLRTQQQKQENLCQEMDAVAVAKMKEWERKELEAAKKEEAVINRKSDAPVTVKPNVPPVAGYRRSTTYQIAVTDPDALFKAFLLAKDRDRRKFFRKFLMLNEQELRAHARDLKDPEAFMRQVPGVKCWKE